MKKNRTIYFLLALVCLGLQSCLFQEEDYFDDSSANRATADVKRCSELLEAAPNGWVMEYYVGKDYSLGGITLLCKFDGQRVTMASQIAGADETVSSLYSVKSEQATMLSSGPSIKRSMCPKRARTFSRGQSSPGTPRASPSTMPARAPAI